MSATGQANRAGHDGGRSVTGDRRLQTRGQIGQSKALLKQAGPERQSRSAVSGMRAGAGAAALAALLLLSGCASSPAAELRQAVAEVTDRANARDAAGLRRAADQLLAVIAKQSGSELSLAEAQALRALAEKVKADAALLEAPPPLPGSGRPTASPTRPAESKRASSP